MGLRNGGHRGQGGVMVVDGEDIFGVYDVQRLDSQGRKRREDSDGVEEEADHVFLGQPTEFNAVVGS